MKRKLIFKSFPTGDRLAEYVNKHKLSPIDIVKIFSDASGFLIFHWEEVEE